MPPTRANGKICYVEIPATDVERSSRFYADVFGWPLHHRAAAGSRSTTRPAR
jgi:predicted enzyme related to lactoylglutathione lyase